MLYRKIDDFSHLNIRKNVRFSFLGYSISKSRIVFQGTGGKILQTLKYGNNKNLFFINDNFKNKI